MTKPFLRALGLGPLVASAVAAGCCFGSTTTQRTVEVDLPPATPVDPALDALWVCPSSEVGTGDHCPAPTPILASTTFQIGVTYRTHDLPRFAVAPTLVVYTGEGAARDDLGRITMQASSGHVPPPGEILTWDVYEEIIAPRMGWPVSTPVHIDMVDATGTLVASTIVTFTGAQTPRPPDRPVGGLIACRTDQLSGPDDDRFCPPAPAATVVRDPAQDIWVTYSSSDAAVWASALDLVLERQGRRGWVREASDELAPQAFEQGDLETLRGHYGMAQDAFAPGSVLRFTLSSGRTQLAQTIVTIQ